MCKQTTIKNAEANNAGGCNITLAEPRSKWAANALFKRVAVGHIDPDHSTYTMKVSSVGNKVQRAIVSTTADGNENEELSAVAAADRVSLLTNLRYGASSASQYKELDDLATKPWTVGQDQVLGAGAYGAVRVFERLDSSTVAVKRFRAEVKDVVSCFLAELAMAEFITNKTEHCVHAVDAFQYMNQNFIVFEQHGESLHRVIQLTGAVDPLRAQSLAQQLMRAIDELHSVNIIHCDIKPSNCLVHRSEDQQKWDLKLCDYGLCESRANGNLGAIGQGPLSAYACIEVVTLPYRAIEVLLGDTSYSYPIDIWAAGCVLAEMVDPMRALFPCDGTQVMLIYQILKRFGRDLTGYLQGLADWKDTFPDPRPTGLPENMTVMFPMLGGMFALNPAQRTTASQALALLQEAVVAHPPPPMQDDVSDDFLCTCSESDNTVMKPCIYHVIYILIILIYYLYSIYIVFIYYLYIIYISSIYILSI
jgi:serine/threonine protein kinase